MDSGVLANVGTAAGTFVAAVFGKGAWDKWRGNGVSGKVDDLKATVLKEVGEVKVEIKEIRGEVTLVKDRQATIGERVARIEGKLSKE